jgi:Domain of unknown function (DUF4259)
MGAWSHESFGNDDACDWAYGLEEVDDFGLIESTLDAVLAAGSEYLEASEASQAIAAAEAIARLQGNFGIKDSYSETVDIWIGKVKLTPTPQLIAKTRQALDRIVAEPSELLELWQESDEGDSWLTAVSELRARISD